MRQQVIHIFGASGAGTTTLGRKLCQAPGFTLLDTDDYFWAPAKLKYTVKREPGERVALMEQALAGAEHAVISGSLVDWGDALIPRFTLAVRLATDTELRIQRLKAREREEFGERIDPGGDYYENHQEFLEYARAYDTGGMNMRSRAKHDEWQKRLQCPLLVLSGGEDPAKNAAKIFQAIGWEGEGTL